MIVEKTSDSQCVSFILSTGSNFIAIFAYIVDKPFIQIDTSKCLVDLPFLDDSFCEEHGNGGISFGKADPY